MKQVAGRDHILPYLPVASSSDSSGSCTLPCLLWDLQVVAQGVQKGAGRSEGAPSFVTV